MVLSQRNTFFGTIDSFSLVKNWLLKPTKFNQTPSALNFPPRKIGNLNETLRSEKPQKRSDSQLTYMRFLWDSCLILIDFIPGCDLNTWRCYYSLQEESLLVVEDERRCRCFRNWFKRITWCGVSTRIKKMFKSKWVELFSQLSVEGLIIHQIPSDYSNPT